MFRHQAVDLASAENCFRPSSMNPSKTVSGLCRPECFRNTGSLALHPGGSFREVGAAAYVGRSNSLWRDTILLERRSTVVGVEPIARRNPTLRNAAICEGDLISAWVFATFARFMPGGKKPKPLILKAPLMGLLKLTALYSGGVNARTAASHLQWALRQRFGFLTLFPPRLE
jgi:hypothetical protein